MRRSLQETFPHVLTVSNVSLVSTYKIKFQSIWILLRVMPESLSYFITAFLYGLLAILAWHGMSQASMPTTISGRTYSALLSKTVLPIAVILHAFLLFDGVLGGGGFNLNLATALSLIVWLTILVYWIESYWVKVGILQNLLLPVAAICVLLPHFMTMEHDLSYANMKMFKTHLAISMLSYSLLTIAALHAVLLSYLEKRIHQGALPAFLKNLPPLMSLERLTFHILLTGFILLTLTLLTGMVFSEELFGKPFKISHKIVFGFLAWLTFAFLLLGRYFWGWRGKIAVRWLLAGFAFLLLAYLGSKFVLEVILHR